MSFDLMGGLCYKKTKNEKGIQKTIMNGKVVHSLIALCVETSEKKKREIATSFHPEHPIFLWSWQARSKKSMVRHL